MSYASVTSKLTPDSVVTYLFHDVNAGVSYIVAAGLEGSASADQSTVLIHVVVVTSAVGKWLLCQLA